MIEIRRATLDDVDAIVALGQFAHYLSANAQYPYASGRARILVASCICRGNMVALVAVRDGEIVGFLLGHRDSHTYMDMDYATDLAFVSQSPGAGRKLLKVFEDWAFSQNVDQIVLGVVNGGKDLKPLYERMGFQHVGGMFTKNRRG